MAGDLVFRGLRGRTLEDQMRAMQDGYQSVVEMAVDELGQMILDLRERVESLESGRPVYVPAEVDDAR